MIYVLEDIYRAYTHRYSHIDTEFINGEPMMVRYAPESICNRFEVEAIWREAIHRHTDSRASNVIKDSIILNTALELMHDRIGHPSPRQPCSFDALPKHHAVPLS